jgi:hypothetical protein
VARNVVANSRDIHALKSDFAGRRMSRKRTVEAFESQL